MTKNGTFKAGDKVTSTTRIDKDEVFTVMKPYEWSQWTRNPKDAYTCKSDETGYTLDFYADSIVLVGASAALTQADVDKAVKEAIDALETTTKEVTMNALTTDVSQVKHYPKFEFRLLRAEWDHTWESSVDWSEYGDLTSMSIIALTQEEAIGKARAVATPRSGYTWVFKVLDVRELR